jgi:hypothetical protein
MPRKRKGTDFDAIGKAYGVCGRTTRRWHDAGVQIADPLCVSEALLRMRRPSPAAVKAAAEMLKSELQTIP